MKKVYGKVAVVVRQLKTPLGRPNGERTYVVAHPPVITMAFGTWPTINLNRSTILKWTAGNRADAMMEEFESEGYEPYKA